MTPQAVLYTCNMKNNDFDIMHPPQLNNDFQLSAIGDSSTEMEWIDGRDGKSTKKDRNVLAIPLGQWKGEEDGKSYHLNPLERSKDWKASLLRKVTVAFAAANLIRHALDCGYSINEIMRLLSLDNFLVHMRVDDSSDLGWEVEGVDVISPELAVKIHSNWISSCSVFGVTADDFTGRNVEATIMSKASHFVRQDSCEGDSDERIACYALGLFLHSFFCGENSQRTAIEGHGRLKHYDDICDSTVDEPCPKKKYFLSQSKDSAPERGHSMKNYSTEDPLTKDHPKSCQQTKSSHHSHYVSTQRSSYVSISASDSSAMQAIDEPIDSHFTPLLEVGYPSSLSQLVINLLDCRSDRVLSDECYQNIEEVINDLNILLQAPGRFLFDQYQLSSGYQRLVVNKDKLYGREAEAALLTDTFCRVALTGNSEAVCISGYSGCGKSHLVQSIFESVDAAGGYLVVQKFDETSTQSPISAILSALNELCGLIIEKHSQDELRELYKVIEGGANLTLLSRVLPNINRMNSSDGVVPLDSFNHVVSSGLNFHMLVFAIMRLMRFISSRSHPVMIFLDDLQWADTASLDLVHSILSDLKGSNCVFFVGCYRDQDVKQGHFVFEFINSLLAHEVPCTELHIDGLSKDDLNQMLSDALCVIPRLCKSLSTIVYHKTRGSPFFSLEILNSLINRGIVIYSLRERRWIWDVDQIQAEDITDNVLQMITDKMTLLDDDDQIALKVAACFGIKINESFVRELSRTTLFIDLQFNLDKAAENGFMERVHSGYQFVHDKVREAAYMLIDSKDEYHFNVGMSLYSTLAHHKEGHAIPATAVLAQINHCIPSLLPCRKLQSQIAELNYEESLKSLERSDFTSAYLYIKAAVSMLPEDTWATNYYQSNKYFFQFAKAAYPSGRILEAKDSLNEIIENERGIEDTFQSYILLTKILLLACNDLSQAFDSCHKLLQMLGEDVPSADKAKDALTSQVSKAKTLLEDSELLHGKQIQTAGWRSLAVMQAYDQLVTITYMSHPDVMPYYAGRWAQYALINKVTCRYTPKCIVSLAAVLCRDLSQDARIGYKYGKLALIALDYSYVDDAASVLLSFYGFVGDLFEPIQACVDMLRRGYEMAMQAGNLSVAAFHKIFVLARCAKTGMNLLDLKSEIDVELSLSAHRAQTFMAMRLRCYRETIQTLIGDKSTGHSAHFGDEDLASKPSLIETQCLDEMMCSVYLGKPERIHLFSKLYLESSPKQRRNSIPQRSIYIAFYFGLSVAALYRIEQDPLELTKLDDSISIVAKAAKFSEWNFKNKVALLKAELASVEEDADEAEDQYDVAITAARSSKFIHEEGLACELAGFHCKNHGKVTKALNLFREAERCYQAWGSKVKANQMVCVIQSLSAGR
ncbi:hypothetical protein HJC23_006636 [Cyclotella cryptica]|uniref:Orc1-like AAA ATPase domain-containing protein n=1 Tax=Cyclotella cryptica TaxID=29204 RepID=A0ABD3QWN3_9STRA